MILTDEEKRMRDAAEGAATAAAMNLITNDIEVAVEGALLDGMLCLASWDKTAPGRREAATSPDGADTMPPRITRCTAGAAGPTLGSRRPGASGLLGPRSR
jgi:dihydroxy-acid dehydratase